MKGNISLKEFIKEVKEDLRSAVDDDDPFFIMEAVELEVSFGLDVEAKAGAKFVVFDLSSKAKAQQSHKVKINLTPFVTKEEVKPKGKTKITTSSTVEKSRKPTAKVKSPVSDRKKPTASDKKVVKPSAKKAVAKKKVIKKA